MLFRAGAAIATVVFLHGAGNLERDAGALMADAGKQISGNSLGSSGLVSNVSAYCQSAPGTCLTLAKQAGSSLLGREDAALHTAAKGSSTQRLEAAAPLLPLAGDSILPPRRKSRQ